MRPALRMFLALTLIVGVFLLTDLLFPPIRPEVDLPSDGVAVEVEEPDAAEAGLPDPMAGRAGAVDEVIAATEAERLVTVETPLYRMTLSNHGGVVRSIVLFGYESFAREGPVELVREGESLLRGLWIPGGSGQSFDLSLYPHVANPARNLRLGEGDGPETLTFRYEHPAGRFFSEVRYTFHPDSYVVQVEGSLPALERSALFLDLGPGLEVNELREAEDRRMMSYAGNHIDDDIRSRPLERVDEPEALDGPLRWAALKSKFFVEVILPGSDRNADEFLPGVRVLVRSVTGDADEESGEVEAQVQVGMSVSDAGRYAYRAYLGPMERERLIALGNQLEEVNPYGWALLRPVIRPFVNLALWAIRFFHETLLLSYGWVLVAIGVVVRILMWPLNRKMMLSQVKSMAVAPLAQEIKTKYAHDQQRMIKETQKLYREQGVNPMAGCLPMLIPMPVLIALFFVFQNTIEMRGVPFLWFPDLSAPDPINIMPILMGGSTFLTQFITMRLTGGAANPQMKMMMYMMPIMLMVFFWRFPSGLHLYYTTMNLASIPQQILIGRERKRVQARSGPVRRPA